MRERLLRQGRPSGPVIVAALAVGLFLGALAVCPAFAKEVKPLEIDPLEQAVTQGALRVKAADGTVVECPLKHTDVRADISGFIARVRVRQTFYNPYKEKIEAVYVFPLPHTAAVDEMTMVIGERRIVGVIKRREAARLIYEQALAAGLTAALLEQERPNIFTQSVGNIKPHQEINIEISYVDVLKYDMGTYEFHFPMVVGPRYIPGAPISKKPDVPDELEGKVGEVEGPKEGADPEGTGWAPDTDRVPDASRITPPVLKPGFRTGHDISLAVKLDSGVPVRDLDVIAHKAELEREGKTKAFINLSPADAIPNKDFVLKYAVVGKKPEMAVLSYRPADGEGYFMLMIQPKIEEKLAKAPPREICFLIDVSGSMSGAPTEKVKQAMRDFFKLSKPDDRIQVVTFAGSAQSLFEGYVPADEKNVAAALNFTEGISGRGGTEMLKGIKKVLADPADPKRVRIVVMLTDGYIGNEAEIIAEVGKRAGDQVRFWTIGIGSSPNRFLIDGVAKTGGGMSEVLELQTDPAFLVRRIVERIHRAQFANIEIDWKLLPVFETYPAKVPELWAGRPVILFGRYEAGGKATIELDGTVEGEPLTYKLRVTFPDEQPDHDVLAKVWARRKIEDLSAQMFYGDVPEVVEEITQVALDYSLMSQYTSFVAVDESERGKITEPARPPRRMVVPVPLPEGVSYEGVFGPLGGPAEFAAIAGDSGGGGMMSTSGGSGKGSFKSLSMASRGPSRGYARVNRAAGIRQSWNRRPKKMTEAAYSYSMRGAILAGKSESRLRARPPVMFEMDASREPEDMKAGAWHEGHGRLVGSILQAWSAQRHKEAVEAITKAEELKKAGDLEAAMARYQQALLLETAFLRVNRWNDDGTSAKAADALKALMSEIAKARTENLKALDTRLDLIIRDKSVAEALEQIARAAGIGAIVVDGSIEDACEMLGVSDVRVTYLDLRGATVAQALDWLLTPVQLTWRLDDNSRILVGTSRRLGGVVPWVYPVADLAIPSKDELEKEPQKVAEAALNDFLKGVRLTLGQNDDLGLEPGSAVMISPGELLVYGDSKVHKLVAAFLSALADSEAEIAVAPVHLSEEHYTALKALQAATSKRWAARAELREKRIAWRAKVETLRALDHFGWQLLAGACRGDVDDEALTELRIAWNSPKLAEILSSESRWLVMRVAWILGEAAATVSDDKDLRALATKALGVALEHFPACTEALKEKPDDAPRYFAGLYAALALNNARALGVTVSEDTTKVLGDVLSLLTSERKDKPLAPAVTVVRALWHLYLDINGKPDAQTAALAALISAQTIAGDDLVVLAALAARRLDGEVWLTFRKEMPDLIGGQPLNGNVVLVVNRLSTAPLSLLARK